MGGVDLMDGLMGSNHIRAKTRDAMTRILYHFIDMTLTNSYVLYRRIHTERLNDSNDTSANDIKLLQLPEFREEIAAALVASNEKRSIGRPNISTQDSSSQATSSGIGKRAIHPVGDVRFDQFDHFPLWMDRSGKKKCKLCKKSDTQCICSKCSIHLCCGPGKNCFNAYHNR